jgi:hypothetical protein
VGIAVGILSGYGPIPWWQAVIIVLLCGIATFFLFFRPVMSPPPAAESRFIDGNLTDSVISNISATNVDVFLKGNATRAQIRNISFRRR